MLTDATRDTWTPRILSLVRIIAALLFLQHGVSKLFGWPGSTPANFQIVSLIGLAALLEAIGGILLAFGIFTRITAFVLSGEMAVAYFMGHAPSSFYPIVNRGEAAILFCFIFLYLAFAGGGPWGIDGQRRSG